MFGMSVADTIRIILMGIFILISIVITVVVSEAVHYSPE